jgi:hypothetical protein
VHWIVRRPSSSRAALATQLAAICSTLARRDGK